MGTGEYIHYFGLLRLAMASGKKPDPFAQEVLIFHEALRSEMGVLVSHLLPQGEKLRGMDFKNLNSVIEAAWKGTPENGKKLCTALRYFNELRNRIAHPDDVVGREKAYKNLVAAYNAFGGEHVEDPQPGEIARVICGAMGNDPDFSGLKRAVNAVRDGLKDILVNIEQTHPTSRIVVGLGE